MNKDQSMIYALVKENAELELEIERLREMLSCYQWVSVKARLPLLSREDWNNDFQVYKSSTRVLITLECNPDYIFTGIYTDKGWMSDGRILDDVIAWMPLPTPYVETKED